jgi:hypothetical protein
LVARSRTFVARRGLNVADHHRRLERRAEIRRKAQAHERVARVVGQVLLSAGEQSSVRESERPRISTVHPRESIRFPGLELCGRR